MASTDYTMWPHYRAKYYDLVDALEECFPDVLAEQGHLRQEVIRIKAYEALIDKIHG
jgi:hypothetical protein